MSRREMESFLIRLRYPLFKDGMEKVIIETKARHKCSDTADPVIDSIWLNFHVFLRSLERKGESLFTESLIHDPGGLTASSRELIRQYIDGFLTYAADLRDMNDDEFQSLHDASFEKESESSNQKQRARAEQRERWAFFHRPSAKANYEEWLAFPSWSVEETVALTLDKTPTVVNPESLGGLHKRPGGSPFREEFGRRLDLFKRSISLGELQAPNTPIALLDWAERHGLEYPERLRATLGKVPASDSSYKRRLAEAEVEISRLRAQLAEESAYTREQGGTTKKTAFRLILGMAIARFEHRTGANSFGPGNIERALRALDAEDMEADGPGNECNFGVGNDKIRQALTEAAELLDANWRKSIQWSPPPRQKP